MNKNSKNTKKSRKDPFELYNEALDNLDPDATVFNPHLPKYVYDAIEEEEVKLHDTLISEHIIPKD